VKHSAGNSSALCVHHCSGCERPEIQCAMATVWERPEREIVWPRAFFTTGGRVARCLLRDGFTTPFAMAAAMDVSSSTLTGAQALWSLCARAVGANAKQTCCERL
jgi:hypothetical protein